MAGQKQEVTNEELTILKVFHNDEPGDTWKPRQYPADHEHAGEDMPYEPDSKVLAVPYGSPENTAEQAFKIKQAKFWIRPFMRKGKSYTCTIKRGVTNGYHWAHIEDLVNEILDNGDMKRIPKEAKDEKDGGGRPTPPPPGKPPAQVKAAAPGLGIKPAASTTSDKPAPGSNPAPAPGPQAAEKKDPVPPARAPRPKPSEAFIKLCFEGGTDQFFRMQDGFAEDGWILKQAHDHALQMSIQILAWKNRMQMDVAEAQQGTFAPLVDQKYKEEILKWTRWFEWFYSEERWNKTRARMEALLKNCYHKDQVIALVELAWTKLPATHYDLIRDKARERLEGVEKDGRLKAPTDPEAYVPTATPEYLEPQLEGMPAAPPHQEPLIPAAQSPAVAGEYLAPPGPAAPPPEVDPKEVEYTLKAMGRYTAFDKVLKFWNETKPQLQAVEEVRQGLRLWVADFFMKHQYQAEVDGIREKLPPVILTPDLAKTLHARYAEMVPF